MPVWLIVVLVIVVLIIVWVVSTYNVLVKLRNKVRNLWSQIDVQLKRRADLIPNLVETVKGYAKHEKGTLESVIQARNTYVTAKTPEEEMKASGELTQALSKLMVLTENYPELKADKNFLQLQNDLKDCEDKIAYSRQFYNDAVNGLNNKIEMFPSNIVAGIFNFKPEKLFEASEADRVAPKVEF